MASSWGGTQFQPNKDGLFDSMPVSGDLEATIRHIRYSNNSVVDLGGFTADHYAHLIYLDGASFTAMKASRGAIAELIVNDISYGDAQLLKFQETGFRIDGGVYLYAVNVDFVLGAIAV